MAVCAPACTCRDKPALGRELTRRPKSQVAFRAITELSISLEDRPDLEVVEVKLGLAGLVKTREMASETASA